MKRNKYLVGFDKILFIIPLGIYNLTIQSQTIDSPYEVATWQGSCDAAVTYTFDDGCSNQFSKAIPMFNEFGFCGTFFTVTNWSPNWTALQNAASQGHEVASHTVSHPDLSTLDATEQNTELESSADAIYSHIEGLNGMTMAYPYCIPGIDSITALYYFAARGCQGFVEPSTPGDFLNISSIICGELGDVNSTDAFQQRVDAAANSNGWCVYLIHGIDNDGGYSPLASDKLRASLEYLDANRDKFWVATFGNVARYIRERNCLTVNALEETDDTIKLELSDTLDNEIYNQPVTLRRPLPEGWEFARGFQNGEEIHTSLIEINTEKYILLNAIPDKGELVLYASEVPIADIGNYRTDDSENSLRIRIDQDRLLFDLPQTSLSVKNVRLYNIMGMPVSGIPDLDENANKGWMIINRELIRTGIFFLCLSAGNKIWTQKVIIPDSY